MLNSVGNHNLTKRDAARKGGSSDTAHTIRNNYFCKVYVIKKCPLRYRDYIRVLVLSRNDNLFVGASISDNRILAVRGKLKILSILPDVLGL